MNIRYVSAAMLLVFAMRPCTALPAEDVAVDMTPLIGMGQFSCGQFIEYRKINNKEQMDLFIQWVWGFLTAYNTRGNFGTKWTRVPHIENMPDGPTVLLFLETHCQKHPVDTVLDGTFSLIKELHAPVVWKRPYPG